jgi:Uma2 family endonuclease
MSVLTMPAPRPSPPGAGSMPPTLKRWTVAEFHQLWEEGWFENVRPMLLDGRIYEMPIPGPLHSTGVILVDYKLKALFAQGFVVRVQLPLVMGQWTDPVPDLAVLTGDPRDHATTQPSSAELVVEVADSSVATDLGEKAQLYAAGGIKDYWVTDLNDRVLVVHRDPRPDPASPSGSSYASVQRFLPRQTVVPLASPGGNIAVADLLP